MPESDKGENKDGRRDGVFGPSKRNVNIALLRSAIDQCGYEKQML